MFEWRIYQVIRVLTYLLTLTDYELIMSIYYYLPSALDRLKYVHGIVM